MVDVNIPKLQARAARHPSKHVQRFEPLIKIALDAMIGCGIQIEQRYENQVRIAGRFIGRYEHPSRNAEHVGRMVIYLDTSCTRPLVIIRNAAEAKVFADTVKLMHQI